MKTLNFIRFSFRILTVFSLRALKIQENVKPRHKKSTKHQTIFNSSSFTPKVPVFTRFSSFFLSTQKKNAKVSKFFYPIFLLLNWKMSQNKIFFLISDVNERDTLINAHQHGFLITTLVPRLFQAA